MLFLKFAPDQKTWQKLSLIISTIALIIGFLFLSLFIFQTGGSLAASALLFTFIPVVTVIYAVEFRSVISAPTLSPDETEPLLEYKKRFYEWLWLVSAGLGVLCDTLKHLSH